MYVVKSVTWIGDIMNRKWVSHQWYPYIVENSSNCTCFPLLVSLQLRFKRTPDSALSHFYFPAVMNHLPPCYTEKALSVFITAVFKERPPSRTELRGRLWPVYTWIRVAHKESNEKSSFFIVVRNMNISSIWSVLMDINTSIKCLKKAII